ADLRLAAGRTTGHGRWRLAVQHRLLGDLATDRLGRTRLPRRTAAGRVVDESHGARRDPDSADWIGVALRRAGGSAEFIDPRSQPGAGGDNREPVGAHRTPRPGAVAHRPAVLCSFLRDCRSPSAAWAV